tara:strand:- start:215 stop:787 length:573 start_codon:yes stop_codon:yes gene_type:complete
LNNIIFFGPPGAGKGTQAKIIADFLDLPHLSTGEILRSKIEEKDNLGILVKEIIASGKLVSDKILNEIVSEKLVNDCNNGFILDGYPRTLDQSIFLNKFLEKKSLSINFIFNIEIDFKTLNNRIMIRSKKENREDDNISVIKTRYQEYLNTTKGVSEKYNKDYPEIFFNIDGDHEINEITSKIKKILLNS